MIENTRLVVVAGGNGKVIAQNSSARRMLGPGIGKYCWDYVGQLKDDEDKMPCTYGCVMALLAKGINSSQQAKFNVNGKRNDLSCVPVNGTVICILGCGGGKSPAMMQSLTPREREILMLLADGETTTTVAELLGVNESTVRTHVERMRNKLAVNTRAAVVAEGFRLGYLE